MKPLKLIALLALWISRAHAGSIGIYSDSACSGNSLTLHAGESAVIHVSGNTLPAPDWAIENQIDGAEFRIEGLPPGWQAVVVPAPGLTVIGDPLGNGIDLALIPRSGCVPFLTLTIQATYELQDVGLRAVAHRTPGNQWPGCPTDCPLLHYNCGAPCDVCATCATGLSLCINPTDCRVSVSNRSWGAVRMLYKK
jgi:hypothetical protein